MLLPYKIAVPLLAWASLVSAQTSKFCTSQTKVCANINIPSTTDTQDLYLQITSPQSNGWAAVGMGSGMAGSLIFLMYPSNEPGKVTLSPRLGKGHVMPQFEKSIDIVMLEGSGVTNNKMTANFLCKNCRSWNGGELSVTSTEANFIWAVGTGQNVRSSEKTASIRQHSAKGTFQLDLVAATGGSGGNPFSNGTGDNGDGGNGDGNDSGNEDNYNNNTGNDNGGQNNNDLPSLSSLTRSDKVLIAHGVIMAVTWLLLFPFGATIIRFLGNIIPNAVHAHAGLQCLNVVLVLIAAGLGIWKSELSQSHYLIFHQFFGTVIAGLLFVQIALGSLHHSHYQRYRRGSPYWTPAHLWLGRIVIVCGITNGGIGIMLPQTGAPMRWVYAYSVVAGIVGLTYIVAFIVKIVRGKKNSKGKGTGKEGTGLIMGDIDRD